MPGVTETNTHNRAEFLKKLMGQATEQATQSGSGVANLVSEKGLSPYKGEWGEKQVLHLLRRSLFSVKQDELRYFSKRNLHQCLDELFAPIPAPSPPINAYNNGEHSDPHVPAGQTWVNATYGPLPPGFTPAMRMSLIDSFRRFSLKGWWAGLMVHQKPNITDKMLLFWHTAISTQMKQVMDARYSYKHLMLLHSHALGNFKQLIRQVSTDPQMLVYQNGNTNTASAPNENYARELQELFTVGKGPGSHYTEEDVRTAARVLTGWVDNFTSIDSTNVSSGFLPEQHDTGDKKFSAFYNNTIIKGRTGADGAKELDDLVNMIFATTETARALCRKLYRYFVYYNIDDTVEKNVITPLAHMLVAKNFEVKGVVRTLLSSEHFFDEKNMGCIIKSPAELVAGMIRQFNVQIPGDSDYVKQYKSWIELANLMENMDMNIGDPPSVAGWAAYYQKPQFHEFWINSDTLSTRNGVTETFLSKEGYTENGVLLKLDYLKFTAGLSNPANPGQLISDSVRFLCPVAFDDVQLNYVKKQFLLSGQSDDSYWSEAWNKYIANPGNPEALSEVDSRLQRYYVYLLSRAEYQLI